MSTEPVITEPERVPAGNVEKRVRERLRVWDEHPARMGQLHGHEACDGDGCPDCLAPPPMFSPNTVGCLLDDLEGLREEVARLANIEAAARDLMEHDAVCGGGVTDHPAFLVGRSGDRLLALAAALGGKEGNVLRETFAEYIYCRDAIAINADPLPWEKIPTKQGLLASVDRMVEQRRAARGRVPR